MGKASLPPPVEYLTLWVYQPMNQDRDMPITKKKASAIVKKLDEFISSSLYQQPYPVIKVTGAEKVQILRKELQARRLQALANGQVPLKFIKVLDKSPRPVKSVSGPKPPAPNLP